MSSSWEWEYVLIEDDFIVKVNKLGGGTVGKSYTGGWDFQVVNGSVVINDRIDNTGTSKTHGQVARMVQQWQSKDSE